MRLITHLNFFCRYVVLATRLTLLYNLMIFFFYIWDVSFLHDCQKECYVFSGRVCMYVCLFHYNFLTALPILMFDGSMDSLLHQKCHRLYITMSWLPVLTGSEYKWSVLRIFFCSFIGPSGGASGRYSVKFTPDSARDLRPRSLIPVSYTHLDVYKRQFEYYNLLQLDQ